MKKLITLMIALMVSALSYGQFAVTTNSGSGLAAGYPSLAAAITALNAATITSPVVITCPTGTETAPAGGYSITATGTVANTIIIQGNGAANSIITAPNPAGTVGALNDAIFKLIGADYVTIQGFAMNENGLNTTTAAANNNMVEWGVALLYATTINGAQNCTIQNNSITLNRTYQNTWGIYSNSTHSATAVTTSATATTTAGGNSGLIIYSNIISNVNQGICVVGPTAAADHNTGIDIGGTSAPQGNTITNWGTTGTFSGYANVSGTINSILVRNSKGFNVSFNTLTSSVGGNTATTSERAIFIPSFSNAPTGTFTNNINNNNISVQSGYASGTLNGIINETTTGTATSTLNMNSNNFNTFGHTVAGTGACTFLSNAMLHLNISISSNTFTNITLNTTGSVNFVVNAVSILATGSLNINSNAIVTAFNKTGAGGTLTFNATNASSAAGSVINFQNNNFSNITVTGATSFVGINNTDGGAPTKTFTGNIFNNINGGTGSINPMTVNYFGTTTSSVSSNTITNITWGAAITALTIGGTGTATVLNVSGNIINNISSTSSSVTGITCSNPSTLVNINNNSIKTLSSTAGSPVIGIGVTGATNTSVFKNTICDLSGSNASSTVNGILVSLGTAVSIYNNRIGDLRTPAANAANPLIGISITGGTNVYAYYNTVYLNGASTGALFGSSAIYASTSPNVTLNNNIFYNASSVTGAGLAAAYRRSTTALGTYISTSNNNLFFGSTIFTDGTNTDATMLAYKARVASRDAASVTENLTTAPTFLSTTCGNSNFLKISTTVATQLESGGAPVTGITDDFEAEARNGSTPDIGADEFTGIAADLTAPNISAITLVGNACDLISRTVTATISDPSGVDNAGFKPQIYFRKNGGSYFSAAGSLTSGTVNSGTWTFTITYATVSNVIPTDVIDYFIVAQDVPGNAGGNPSGGLVLTNVNTVTTPPTTPLTYTILSSIGGPYNVGSGQTYTTLTAAINAYNTSCLSSAVTFNLTDAAYTEAAAMTINANADASATNTLTIKPTQANTTIVVGTTGSATAIFVLNGADYVIIDGAVTPLVNSVCPPVSSARDLTITNTNTGTTSAVVWLQTTAGGNAATNNIVRNCNLVGSGNTQTIVGLGAGGTAIGASAGTGNNNNRFENNNISKTQFGIYSAGLSAANKNTGTVINQNLINTVSPNNVSKGGILVFNENNITISGNKVSEMALAGSPDVFGISLGFNAITTSTFTGAEVTNATVTKNVVGNIRNTGTFSAGGICVAAATTGTNLIANNMISGVSANGTGGDFSVGVFIGGGAGSTTQIYYNTITMVGTQTGGSDKSYCIAVGGSDPIVDIRNNILVNTQNNGTGNNYAIGYGYSTFVNLTSDHNDYYVTSSGTIHFIGATTSISLPTNQLTVANLQSATAKDGFAQNFLPVFSGTPYTLSLNSTDPGNLINLDAKGTPVSVTDDIDCAPRNGSTPDIGADEFTPPGCGTASAGTAMGDATFCGPTTSPTITASGFSNGLGSGYQWYYSTSIVDYPNAGSSVGGQTNPAALTTGLISTTTYYWLRVTCSDDASTVNGNMITITIYSSAANITGPASKCVNDPAVTLSENGGTGTAWLWSPNGETTQSITANPASTTTYGVTVTSPGPCTATATFTLTVNPNPTGVTATASSYSVCQGTAFDLNSSANAPSPTILTQDFESGIGSWTITAGSSGALADFNIRAHGWLGGSGSSTTFNSAGGTNFVLADPDAAGTGVVLNTQLTSPSFSTVGYTAASLSFRHYYKHITTSQYLQISIAGGAWTNLKTYSATVGTGTTFATETISLNAYLGLPDVKIRFNYTGGWLYYWAIDDIALTGTPTAFAYGWTSSPAAYTSGVQNPTGVTQTETRDYTVTVTGIGGCATTASTGNVAYNALPTITLSATNVTAVSGGTGNLPYSATTESPVSYSIVYDAAALSAGFMNVTDEGLLAGQISVAISGTAPVATYNAVLTVKNGNGCESVGYAITVKVMPALTISQNIGTTLQASCTPVSGAYYYTFRYRLKPGGSWIGISSLTNYVKISNLTQGKTYECILYVYNSLGQPLGYYFLDDFNTFTTTYTPSYDIGTTVQVDWSDFSPWANFYLLQYKKSIDANWLNSSGSTLPQKVLYGLDPFTDYDFRVIVYKNGNYWGTTEKGTFKTGQTIFTFTNITSSSADIEWTSYSPWITGQTFRWKTELATVWNSFPHNLTNTKHLTGLLPSTDYVVQIWVYKSVNWGPTQISQKFTTLGAKTVGSNATGNDVNVYPNPFLDEVNLDFFTEEGTVVNWNIYDMTGRLILSGNEGVTSGYGTLNIDATDLPKGVYMLNAMLNDQMRSFRIVKQ